MRDSAPGKAAGKSKIADPAAKSTRSSGDEVGSRVELLECNTAEGGVQAPPPSTKQPIEQLRRSHNKRSVTGDMSLFSPNRTALLEE
jgi:hypothetical protein